MDDRITGRRHDTLCRRKPRKGGFGVRKQKIFLEHLAATCNVRASAKAAAISDTTCHLTRQTNPAFAAAWKAALQHGYDRLEDALLSEALGVVEPVEFDPQAVELKLVDGGAEAAKAEGKGGSAATPRRARGAKGGSEPAGAEHIGSGLSGKVALVNVQLALALLNRRDGRDRKGPTRGGTSRATAEEIEAAINRKLDTLAARLKDHA